MLNRNALLASKLLSSFTIRDLWHSSIHLLITSFPGNFIVKPNVLGRFYLVNTIIQLLNVWDLQFTFLIYCKLLKLLVYTTLTKHLIGIKNLIWWCLLTILIYQCLSLVRWSSCSKVLYLLSIRASHTLCLWYINICQNYTKICKSIKMFSEDAKMCYVVKIRWNEEKKLN